MNTNTHASTDWLDLGQADREGPFSIRTIWTLISTGQLPAYRPLKKKILIKRSDLNKHIEATRVGADLDKIVDEVVAEMRQIQNTRPIWGNIPDGSFFTVLPGEQEKGLRMSTLTQPVEPRKNDPAEEQACLDLLLRHKRTTIAATAWECYIRGGRGALLTDGKVTEYLPRGVIKRHPGITSATRQQLRQESKTYNPRREVLLVIPWSNRQWTIARVGTNPDPETAFLQRVGTDGLPPLQLVQWHGHRSSTVGGGRDAGQ